MKQTASVLTPLPENFKDLLKKLKQICPIVHPPNHKLKWKTHNIFKDLRLMPLYSRLPSSIAPLSNVSPCWRSDASPRSSSPLWGTSCSITVSYSRAKICCFCARLSFIRSSLCLSSSEKQQKKPKQKKPLLNKKKGTDWLDLLLILYFPGLTEWKSYIFLVTF